MVNNEKEEGSTKWSIKLKRLKLVQHCIQLPIAKNENFSKTAVTFLIYDNMFVTVTILYKSCEILIMYIFHESTFQTLLQLSRFSIWKVNPSLKESSLEFWCNVTLNNCMSLKKQTMVLALVTAAEVLVLVWNETPQLICQYSVVPYQQFKRLSCRKHNFSAFSPSSLR